MAQMTSVAVDLSRSSASRASYNRLTAALEWPLALLALAVVPALILEDRASSATVRNAAFIVNWVVWLAFCGEFIAKLCVAPDRRRYIQNAWFNLTIIVLSPPFLVPDALQAVRGLRALRLLRLLRLVRATAVATMGLRVTRRLLRHRSFHYVLVVAVTTVALGALGIYLVERGKTVQTIDDALWWAVVTVTTVGYGDVSPVTGEGRLIAVVLMFVGISVISVFTATVANFFFEEGHAKTDSRIEDRIDRMEAKLDRLLQLSEHARSNPDS